MIAIFDDYRTVTSRSLVSHILDKLFILYFLYLACRGIVFIDNVCLYDDTPVWSRSIFSTPIMLPRLCTIL